MRATSRNSPIRAGRELYCRSEQTRAETGACGLPDVMTNLSGSERDQIETDVDRLTQVRTHRGGPRIRAQLLYYPLTDPQCTSDSHRRFATG
ncbi:hypothetical protein CF165_26810 [Amycolatopsis vastitatis]|uniref:Uncharacterized protein n=1 Tax=Amycolatopsis vastitatis TaxID=1905142 RepID=A0A229T009_9PSEU|nr:hypothetical protein CF165_26810 [Amycolatopsis vastitatis]